MARLGRSAEALAMKDQNLHHVGTCNKLLDKSSLFIGYNIFFNTRLLARLKSNYQLGELVMVDHYTESIQLIAKFTVESLNMWQFAPNSIHYLLSLWQRMVASVPYVKATEPHLLETYTPEVTQAYITSRLESVAVVIRYLFNRVKIVDDFHF